MTQTIVSVRRGAAVRSSPREIIGAFFRLAAVNFESELVDAAEACLVSQRVIIESDVDNFLGICLVYSKKLSELVGSKSSRLVKLKKYFLIEEKNAIKLK